MTDAVAPRDTAVLKEQTERAMCKRLAANVGLFLKSGITVIHQRRRSWSGRTFPACRPSVAGSKWLPHPVLESYRALMCRCCGCELRGNGG
jgi:hypothetical protein